MITVNLIPEEYRQKPPSAMPAFLVALVAVGVAIGLIYRDHTSLKRQVNSVVSDLKTVEANINQLQEVQKKIEAYRAKESELNLRAQVINEVALSRVLWSRKLFEICYLTPDTIWLTKLEAAVAKKTGKSARGAAPRAGTAASTAGGVETEKILDITGIVYSPASNEEGVKVVGTFMNSLGGLAGLQGTEDPAHVDEALKEQKKRVEDRNKEFRKVWRENEKAIKVSDGSSSIQEEAFASVLNKTMETLGTKYGLTEQDARVIHASTSFATDFVEPDLVVIEDAVYLGKPVKSFTIRCRAKSRAEVAAEASTPAPAEVKPSGTDAQASGSPSPEAVQSDRPSTGGETKTAITATTTTATAATAPKASPQKAGTARKAPQKQSSKKAR